MKKARLIPILLALTLTGCLAQNTEPEKKDPTEDPSGEPANPDGGNTDPEGGNTDPEGGDTDPEGGDTDPGEGGEGDGGEDENPDPTNDYISKVKLTAHSDFSSYESKTFIRDKISRVTLDQVEDGDTAAFKEGDNSLVIRFSFTDTPEDDETWGSEATQFTTSALTQAKTIVITNHLLSSDEDVLLDSTGERYLGLVWYSRKENATLSELRCLNLEIVYEGYSKNHCLTGTELFNSFAYCQSAAQQAKRKIWENYVAPENDFGYDHYDGYYGALTWENGADLKQKLYTIIHDGYTALPYKTPNWETNQYADQDLYNHDEVNIVYSDDNLLKTFTSKQGNGGWQREHAFCASLMTGSLSASAVDTLGRATDFHNLFASSEKGNTSRGNKNFGMADPSDTESYQDTGHYKCDSKNFEPSDFDKGRLARAIFYMGVMYSVSENAAYEPLRIVEEYVDYTEGNCQYAIGNLSTLLTWNYYNVDFLEYQHNESVYSHIYSGVNKAQGNRNPFVDYPALVDYVYGDKQDQAGDLKNLCPTEVRLETTNEGTHHYAIKDVRTSYMVGEDFDSSCYTLLAVDWKLNETAAPASADKTTAYTFVEGDIGNKSLTVDTDLNDIVIKGEVSEYKDTFNIADCKYYSGDPLTKTGYVSQLSNAKTTLAVDGEVTISQYSTNGIKIPKTFNSITLTSESLQNIDKIGIKTNGNKNGRYQIQIKVGTTEVHKETLTGLGTGVDPMETLVKLDSPLSGVVTIIITPVSSVDAVYIAALGINAD